MKYLMKIVMFYLLAASSHSETNNSLTFPKENFKRLFTSHETRRILDRQKINSDNGIEATQQTAPSPVLASQGSTAVKVQGYILGEDGKHKVWLSDNISASQNGFADAKTSQALGSASKVAVQAEGHTRLLKPGQTWFVDKHEVRENYLLVSDNSSTDDASNSNKHTLAHEDTTAEKVAVKTNQATFSHSDMPPHKKGAHAALGSATPFTLHFR